MKIKELFLGLDAKIEEAFLEKKISTITDDSRTVTKNSLFIGNEQSYIDDAINRGACAIVTSTPIVSDKACCIIVDDIIDIKHWLMGRFHQLPRNVVAVTGTNGKTSVTNFYSQILKLIGCNSAVIGTTGIKVNGQVILVDQQHLTTPSLSDMFAILHKIKTQYDTDYVAIEASSHGLDQNRIKGINIAHAAVTNITSDHMDYHHNYDNYFHAKMKLFDTFLSTNGVAVINSDMTCYNRVMQHCLDHGIKTFTVGYAGHGIKIERIDYRDNLQIVDYVYNAQHYHFKTELVGTFQVYNILVAVSLCLLNGFQIDEVNAVLGQLYSIEGRMQPIIHKNRSIYIDYSHTADSLDNALQELKKIVANKLWVIFGCGGNRDTEKRAKMGLVASKHADYIIVTDDNPRNEPPEQIRQQIIDGISIDCLDIGNREEAIKYAMLNLSAGDILLVAGKGHEDYQIIGNKEIHFSDAETVMKYLKELK